MVVVLLDNPKINTMPDNNDAQVEEKETPTESSTEEKTSNEESTDGSEPAKTPAEDELGSGIKNYDQRFKDIYRDLKEAERKNKELESKINSVKEPEKPKEENKTNDFNTWDEVFEAFEKRQAIKAESRDKEIKSAMGKVEADIAKVKETFGDIDENAIWDYFEKNKTMNVFEAAMFVQNNTSNKESKSVSSKIGSSSKNSTGKPARSWHELHNTSLDDI